MKMTSVRFSLLAAMSLALTCFASDPQSGPDQYAGRQHDQSLKALKSEHRFDLTPTTPGGKEVLDNNIVPDLQVGYGDGLFGEATTTIPEPAIPEHKRAFPREERRKREANARKPRSYFAYTVYTPASISYTVWRPPVYRLQRPYYIPIFGTRGRFPIYFPPQPLFLDHAFPVDNPSQPPNNEYVPPETIFTDQEFRGDNTPKPVDNEYLPPETVTTTDTPSTNKNFTNRFRPIWDTNPASTTASPTPTPTQPNPPTRPSRPNTSTFPPLIHRPDPNLAVIPVVPTTTTAATTTTTSLPPPPREELPAAQSVQTVSPAPSPSQCVWAIINCCSAGSKDVSQTCFERLGCPGPFWDRSPCDTDFARLAIETALKYYQTK